MSTEPNGTNFDDMSLEDLEQFITSNNTDEEVQPEEDMEEQPEVIEEEPTEEKIEEQPQATTPKSNPYEGKTSEDLLRIIQDQQRFISQQGNQIGSFRKELDDLKVQSPKNTEPEVDSDLAAYNTEDIAIIEKIIEKKLTKKEQEEKSKLEQRSIKAKEDNHKAFLALSEDKELFEKVGPILDKMYEQAGNHAIYQEGWVASAVGQAVKSLILKTDKVETVNKPNTDLQAQKMKANTISSTNPGNKSSVAKKDVKDMSPAEYLEFAKKNLGLKDLRSKK